MIVCSYLYQLEPNGELLLLDSNAASPPSVSRTWFISLVLSWTRLAVSKVKGESKSEDGEDDTDEGKDSERDGDDSEASSGSRMNGRPSVGPSAKAGGRRRKTAPKKKKGGKDM